MIKPIVLCILDGVGIRRDKSHNAVARAKMPFFRGLLKKYPHVELSASGNAVGLPAHTMGNSEVGHIAIGSGRIINQFIRRFQLEDWDKNKPLKNFIAGVKKSRGAVHIVGMISDGRVHSDINEIIFIGKRIAAAGLSLKIHAITDGRDVPPQSAKKYIAKLKRELPGAEFATLMGRYYAMDRNNNLDRVKLAFDAIAKGRSEFYAPDINAALRDAYARGELDEFIKPTVIGRCIPTLRDGILFANYRADRAREILRMLLKMPPTILAFSQYGEGLDAKIPALLPDIPIKNTLGDILAAHGYRQLRIAETEKYNHVTYFFDAERTMDFAGEEKVLIQSPNVATFDLKPDMAANEITDALLPRLKKFDVVILNYANGDMVGHTGNFPAAVKAMEYLDNQLARLVPAVLKLGGTMLITADHGNAEHMLENGMPKTSHTANKVPFIVVGADKDAISVRPDGGLSDIAPTILKLLNIKQPREMTGHSLIQSLDGK